MDINELIESKKNVKESAENLNKDEIGFLVNLLQEKDNEIRYSAFLLLQERSKYSPDVYPFWQILASKICDENSYQRSIGIMLISENVRWDTKNKFVEIFDEYISHCNDEKFITSRQTIQSINSWVKYSPNLLEKTVNFLVSIDINALKETQKKLILIDIVNALISIRLVKNIGEIDEYINNALTGGILDKTAIKNFEKLLHKKEE
ncbi:MAG: hypothetical protein WCR30_00410 [Clostridia bacterium]